MELILDLIGLVAWLIKWILIGALIAIGFSLI